MPSRQNSTYDAVIIGAGHNGLTAASYLARAGHSTLVLERRDIVGGCCVTEQIAPNCRASTTSYIASMLRPEVIRDLHLADYGLRMVPCDPALQVPFPDGQLVSWWANRDRVVEELRKISPKDAETFVRVDDRLKTLARYLQPFFLEPPPEPGAQSFADRQTISSNFDFRNFATRFLLDWQPRRFSGSQLRIGKGQNPLSSQQRLWQTRRPLPARHRVGPAFPLTKRRRARTTRLLRPCDARH